MSETKKFKTESKRLLELMINSIYTNKEIFLRELISNASDAIDKYHFLSLTDETLDRTNDHQILLEINKDNKTLTITDNGIGMTYDELVDGLGTIAKSGSHDFMEKFKEKSEKEQLEIIGQFGVGFYSAYMVADKVTVETKSPFSDKGYIFESSGTETYKISESDKQNHGSVVTLYLKPNTDDEKYDKYLDEYELRYLVKKYSDYVRYPIKMNVTKETPKLDEEGKEIEGEYETHTELETLNSMTPIWKKNKRDLTDEELNEFYKQKYYDFQDPLANIYLNVEGNLNYTSLIYIPKKAPYNLYSDNYEKGLQLYSKGVFIMDKCKELVPDYLRFIKGLVDSSDLSLNISRELLQQSKELSMIATNVEKKIISKLEGMLKNDRDLYTEFFNTYGINIKFGVYDKYGEKKELLKNLLLYTTVNQDKMETLKEYVDNMKEGQEFIYYASVKTKEAALALPQMDIIKNKGYDVLVLTENVDEFAINVLSEYEGKKFKSINQGDLDLLSTEEKEEVEKLTKDKESLLGKIKEALKDEVENVVLSKRLTDSPVCLVSSDGISFEMEKVIDSMPTDNKVKAKRILEINPNHDLFKAIESVSETDEDLNNYAYLLYNQALLIEGLPIKNPVEFSNKMCSLMIKASK